MTTSQWDTFKRAARLELGPIPLALIIDSPWIGYVGVNHLDFFLDRRWVPVASNHRGFRTSFSSGWWLEYGMAAGPSVLGANQVLAEQHAERVPHAF